MALAMPARIAVAAAFAAAAAGGFWLLRTFDPNAAGSLFPPCIFRVATGLYCPGCGITRMLHALAHGDIQRAFAMNAMVMAMLPALALLAIDGLAPRRVLEGTASRLLHNPWLWIGTALAFGVLRNVPYAPFQSLAPG